MAAHGPWGGAARPSLGHVLGRRRAKLAKPDVLRPRLPRQTGGARGLKRWNAVAAHRAWSGGAARCAAIVVSRRRVSLRARDRAPAGIAASGGRRARVRGCRRACYAAQRRRSFGRSLGTDVKIALLQPPCLRASRPDAIDTRDAGTRDLKMGWWGRQGEGAVTVRTGWGGSTPSSTPMERASRATVDPLATCGGGAPLS